MELNIGDIVRINRRPNRWASSGGRNPIQSMDIRYPFTGVVDRIIPDGFIGVSGYGFSLGNLLDNCNIEKILTLNVTQDKVLATAKECPEAAKALQSLFPEAFKDQPITGIFSTLENGNAVIREASNAVVLEVYEQKIKIRPSLFNYRIEGAQIIVTKK